MRKRISKIAVNVLRRKGFHHISRFDKTFFQGVILSSFSQKSKDSTFKVIQVGANTTATRKKNSLGDPLVWFLKQYGSEVSIIYVEPQISLKEELIKNTDNLCAESFYEFVAISSTKGSLDLYRPNPAYMPFSSGVASLHEANVLKRVKVRYKKPELGKHYLKDKVELKNLTEVSKVFKNIDASKQICDFLVVDAEGHDDEVIYSIEDPKTLPNAISFEWKNLSNEKFNNLREFLKSNEYIVHHWSHADCIAIKIRSF